MSRKVENQRFGGPWSLLKVETVASYLQAFNFALRQQPSPTMPFRRIYIDAFAGSGDFSFSTEGAPLFDEDAAINHHAGSAKRALEVDPPFDELIFIEQSEKNVAKLRALCAPFKSAKVISGEANDEVRRLCANTDWKKTRGVVFLDPFGATVDWQTLEAIGRTKALDVWYLFPLFGLYRNAPHDRAALDANKHRTLTKMLGTDGWQQLFYQAKRSDHANLFGDLPERTISRIVSVDEMETFLKRRLEEVFAAVLKPKRLPETGAPMFSLFFAVSNRRAVKVASRIAGHLLSR
ncbi:MAG TPA: three-Cys-motif partner protein TcmP [Dongiaceae bacterium]|nr:three-Cys-motif partner protein TcmP [Dongiaceae bacterium]